MKCREQRASPGNEALQDFRTGFAGNDSAVSTSDYTTLRAPGIPPSPYPRLVSWLRCRQCYAGYFSAGAPGPHPCPACAGGRLQPVGLWDLRTEAAPPGMLRLTIDAALQGEVVQ